MTGNASARSTRHTVARAFGHENRSRLLAQWFAETGPPSPADAWTHAYRLLLWIDRSTGLAHCYESDKSQPGRHWYARSLAFHAWLSSELGLQPTELASEVDWLFKHAIQDLSAAVAQKRDSQLQTAVSQRSRYREDLPEPGDDPELFGIITDVLHPYLAREVPQRVLRTLAQRIVEHLKQENKRKNLIGEGFEDVVAELIGRIKGLEPYTVYRRVPLHELPGFYPPRGGDKVKKVDLGVVQQPSGFRTLLTAKWSIRADREEQLATDFAEYERLEAAGDKFEYVLVTNEFDPARLVAACNRRSGNKPLFDHVVHVNPAGVLAAYGSDPARSAADAAALIASGRLESLEGWLSSLLPR